MRAAMTQLNLSARAYQRILKLARTIAGLAGGDLAACAYALNDEPLNRVYGWRCPDHRFDGDVLLSGLTLRARNQRPVRPRGGGHPDRRPLVRHAFWPEDYFPLRKDAAPPERFDDDGTPFPFLPVGGEGVYEIPVGPVHAGIIEPGHFRLSVVGETVFDFKIRWLKFKVPASESGDVQARAMMRAEEVRESVSLIKQALAQMPGGAIVAPAGKLPAWEPAFGPVEGWRGAIVHWVVTDA